MGMTTTYIPSYQPFHFYVHDWRSLFEYALGLPAGIFLVTLRSIVSTQAIPFVPHTNAPNTTRLLASPQPFLSPW